MFIFHVYALKQGNWAGEATEMHGVSLAKLCLINFAENFMQR